MDPMGVRGAGSIPANTVPLGGNQNGTVFGGGGGSRYSEGFDVFICMGNRYVQFTTLLKKGFIYDMSTDKSRCYYLPVY